MRDTGALTALTTLLDAHLAGLTGLAVLDHIHTGRVMPNITSEAVDGILQGVRDAATHAFAPAEEPVA